LFTLRNVVAALAVSAASLSFASAGSAQTAAEPAMRFALASTGGSCAGCEWIVADGRITPETPAAFERFLQSNTIDFTATVSFNSNGGDIGGAVRLGEIIRAKGLATTVGKTRINFTDPQSDFPHEEVPGGQCLSACIHAFLGGATRTAPDRGIGLSAVENGTLVQQFDHVLRMGGEARLAVDMLAVPAGETRMLTAADAKDFRLTWDPAAMSPLRLEPWREGMIAASTSADGKTTVTISCRSADRGEPSLLYSRATSPNEVQQAAQAFKDLGGIVVFGHTLPKSAMAFQRQSNGFAVRVRLPRDFAGRPLPDGAVSVADHAPASAASMVNSIVDKANLRPAVRLALKNCF
jgi:hypothetical protein